MEAHALRAAFLAVVTICCCGAEYRTANFLIRNPDPQFARQMGEAAESYRKQLAVLWLGQELPNWSRPCPVTVQDGPSLGAGGQTTFIFDRGEVYGWEMAIQGSRERLLDSVLPHEITHMILASHFRRPLPRWADEGAATSVEHISEREKHRRMLIQFLQKRRGIPFNRMFAMEEYPRDIMPLYAQGFSLTDYLIQEGGHRRFVQFLEAGLADGDWHGAVRQIYGYKELGDLQNQWVGWVAQGYPERQRKAVPVAVAVSQEAVAAQQNLASGEVSIGPQPPGGASVYLAASSRGQPVHGSSSGVTPTVEPPFHAAAESTRETNTEIDFGGWRPASQTDPATTCIGLNQQQPASARDQALMATASTESQVNHVGYPQPVERPRQIILEWSHPTLLR